MSTIDKETLHAALVRACPPGTEGEGGSISRLAALLGVTSAGVYKWINEGQVPPGRVPELVNLQHSAFGEVRVAASELNTKFRPVDDRKES